MVEMNRVVHPPTTALTALGALARNFCCFPKGKSQLKLVTQYRLRLAPSRVHWFRLYGYSRSAQLYMFFDQVKFELNVNCPMRFWIDRKSTRLNSSHLVISYAVFCLKKKKTRR